MIEGRRRCRDELLSGVMMEGWPGGELWDLERLRGDGFGGVGSDDTGAIMRGST